MFQLSSYFSYLNLLLIDLKIIYRLSLAIDINEQNHLLSAYFLFSFRNTPHLRFLLNLAILTEIRCCGQSADLFTNNRWLEFLGRSGIIYSFCTSQHQGARLLWI